MPEINNDDNTINVILSFQSLEDISIFKKECNCNDFYIDRDYKTIVGKFSGVQLELAIRKYKAETKIENKTSYQK